MEKGEPERENREEGLPTEGFASWLARTRRAQVAREGADVPCGECRGCCTSGYFIHIRPEETGTLASIPRKLLFPAPGLPKGHVLLGYDGNGHCPMFKDNRCSIYKDRPQTCRTYDCRIFPATGLMPDGKPLISRQAERWRFDVSAPRDREQLLAVQAAARFLREHAESFPPDFVPRNPTQQAVVALKVYPVFLSPGPGTGEPAASVPERVQAVMAAYKRFEAEGFEAGEPA